MELGQTFWKDSMSSILLDSRCLLSETARLTGGGVKKPHRKGRGGGGLGALLAPYSLTGPGGVGDPARDGAPYVHDPI